VDPLGLFFGRTWSLIRTWCTWSHRARAGGCGVSPEGMAEMGQEK